MIIRLALFWFCSIGTLLAGERSPSSFHQVPARFPNPIVADKQVDDFSCGFHAVSAIYRGYGLSAEKANLRERLGTSRTAIPFVTDSKGTLQPDLLRVLNQDGFLTESIDRFTGGNLEEPIFLLSQNKPVLALLETDTIGGMHWVVLTSFEAGNVMVADSLEDEPYQLNLDSLAKGKLLNLITLQPSMPKPGSPYYFIHLKGFKSMLISGIKSLPAYLRVLLILAAPLFAYCAFILIRHFKRRRKAH